MAGVDGSSIDKLGGAAPRSGALLGARARAQYAALAGLRWHMLRNSVRSAEGIFEVGARALTFLFVFAGLGLGLSGLIGFGAYQQASSEEWVYLPVLFWLVLLLWQVVPVMLASFQEQFDLGSLLRFPISFRLFFLLYIVFGLADISTIIGGMCCIGLWVGITLARPELFAWTALAVGGYALFNILLARAVFAWIDRWLAQRKTREILGAVVMLALLSLQFMNPAFHTKRQAGSVSAVAQAEQQHRMTAEYGPWLKAGNAVQKWLPPGLAAVTPRRIAHQQPMEALASLGVLGVWILAVGGLLMVRLRAEYRGENLGDAPSRSQAPLRPRARAHSAGGWIFGGSGPVGAVIEKEWYSLRRTLPQLYALCAPLLLVLMLSGLGATPGHRFALTFPVSLIYAQLGFTKLIFNNLGAEGAGIQTLFLSPTPFRSVLLGKNLFHAMVYAVVLAIAAVLASLRMGLPSAVVAAATLAWLLFALPSNLAIGNLFSLLLPYRVNPGRMTSQRGSQANALLSLLAQAVVLGVAATVFAVCLWMKRLWMAVPVFLAMAAVAVVALLWVLRKTDGIANRQRETLIAKLVKKE